MALKKKIQKKKSRRSLENNNYTVETRKLVKPKVREENYNLDDNIVKINSSNNLFKCGFILTELPFICVNNKIGNHVELKYIFNNRRDIFMRVIPSNDQDAITNKVPQEFCYKIYKAIEKISQREKSDTIIVTIIVLLKEAGLSGSKRNYMRAVDAIERLKGTAYVLNGCFYDIKLGKGNLNQKFNLLQSVSTLTLDNYYEMSEEEQNKYYKYFCNKKVKEIFKITLSKVTYDSMQNKAFLFAYEDDLDGLNYRQEKLLRLIQKWNGYENINGIGEKDVIKRSNKEIASKLSLSWKIKNQSGSKRTIKTLLNALIKKERVKHYETVGKNQTKIVSFSKKEYDEIRAKKKKAKGENITKVNEHLAAQDSHLSKTYTTQMKEEPVRNDVIDIEYEEVKPEEVISVAKPKVKEAATQDSQEVQQLLQLIPAEQRSKGKLLKVVIKYLKTHGAEYIQKNINYTNQQDPRFFVAYLTDALAENYAKNTIEKAKVNPEVAKAKAKYKECKVAKTHGTCPAEWRNNNVKTKACYYCHRFKDQRLAQEELEMQAASKPKETVEAKPAPEVKPEPQKVAAQAPPVEPQLLSEVEQLKLQMQQMMEMQQAQMQREKALQQKIQQLEAEKSTPGPVETSNVEDVKIGPDDFNEHQLSPSTEADYRLIRKWWEIREAVKEKIGSGPHDIHLFPLILDYSRCDENKLTLLALNSFSKNNVIKKGYLTMIKEAAGNIEIMLEVATPKKSGFYNQAEQATA